MKDELPFIVAEVSKNWIDGREASPTGLLSQLFEQVVNTNFARGYVLRSFTLHRMMTAPNALNETLIAVFERDDAARALLGE